MQEFITAAIYITASLVVALAGPALFEVSEQAAGILGILTFLVGALAHENLNRKANARRMELGFEALSQVVFEVNEDLKAHSERLEEIQERLGDEQEAREELNTVRSEVKLLQELVSGLSGVSKSKVVKTKTPAKIAEPPKDSERLLEMVRDGLRNDRVDLFLQPIVSLPQRKARSYECYSRIRNQAGELILPEHYIPVAEQQNMLAAIDNMLLFRCIQLIRKAQSRHQRTGFFVNLSEHTLKDKHFFGDFVDFLMENRSLAKSLVFEIDQTFLDGKGVAKNKTVARLIEAGCRLCLQKVNSLSFETEKLKTLGFDFIKVPVDVLKPYIDDGVPNLDLTRIKKDLDRRRIDLIVEKLEEEEDLLELLDFNIDFGQGFLFGEPTLYSDL